MARYGTFLYGTTLYGAAGSLSSTGLLAQVVDYEKVVIRVVVPDRVGKDYVLIRSYNGSAEQPNEGLVISRGTIADSEFEYIDSPETTGAHLTPGWCYYTLFIIDDLSWVKDAATSVLVPEDRGTYQYLLENLPSIFTSEDFNPLEVVDYNGTLANFLKGFTLTFDEWAGHIDSLLPDRRNAEVVRRLDPTRAESVGLPDEYTIGTAASHRLHREAGKIYAQKGTIDGIATYVKALTGWETVAYEGFNLLLDLDDCSFETGIGNWGVSGGTLTKATVNGTTVTSCDLYDAQTGPMYDFKREGVGLVTLTSASATITLPASNLLKTVPVPHEAVVGDSYTFVVPSRAATGTPDVTAKITWLDGAGATVGSVATGTPLTTGATWASATVTSTVPTGAKYARLSVVVDGADPEAVHLDMLYFGETQSPFYYWDARSVDIVCNPVMVNQIMDPSIDDALGTHYNVTTGVMTVDATQHLLGLNSLKFVGSTDFLGHHDFTSVAEGEYYTLRLAAKGTGTLEVYVEWYDTGLGLLGTSDSLDFGTVTGTWTTDSETVTSPADAAYAKVIFSGTGTVYVDTILFAKASRVEAFFSGSVGDTDGADTGWYGTPGESVSVLYPNRPTKLSRLAATLDYYLPLGVSWRVLLWGDSPVVLNAVDDIPTILTPEAFLAENATLWIDAEFSTAAQVVPNLGTGGSSLNGQLGSTSGADSNDPKFLAYDATDGAYVYLPGVAGNYLSVPDSTALDITGDIDIRVKVALDDWTPASAQMLVAKEDEGSQRSYWLALQTDGTLVFHWSSTGAYLGTYAISTVVTGITDGSVKWVKVTRSSSSGDVKFYLSDDATTWTQLGTTVTSTPSAIFNSTTAVTVGAAAGGFMAAGKFYRAIVKNGIDGTTVLDVDTSVITSGAATSFTATTGQTVTINRSTSGRKAVAVTAPCWLLGTDDYIEVADNALLDFGASDDFTVLAVVRQWATPTNYGRYIGKWNGTQGYVLSSNSTSLGALVYVQDGSDAAQQTTVAQSSGALAVFSARLDRTLATIVPGVGTTFAVGSSTTLVGDLSNTGVFRVGRETGASTSYQDFELTAVAVFRSALNPVQISLINDYYQNRL